VGKTCGSASSFCFCCFCGCCFAGAGVGIGAGLRSPPLPPRPAAAVGGCFEATGGLDAFLVGAAGGGGEVNEAGVRGRGQAGRAVAAGGWADKGGPPCFLLPLPGLLPLPLADAHSGGNDGRAGAVLPRLLVVVEGEAAGRRNAAATRGRRKKTSAPGPRIAPRIDRSVDRSNACLWSFCLSFGLDCGQELFGWGKQKL
jgi:hypothetical protein